MGFTMGLRQLFDRALTVAEQPSTLAVVVALFIIAVTTRLISGRPESETTGGRVASTPGYWLPYIGHVPQMAIATDSFLARLRDKYPKGVFSLLLMGKPHTIVHRPALATQLMNKPRSVADEEWVSEHLTRTNFGLAKSDAPLFREAFHDLHSQYMKHLLSETGLREITSANVAQIKDHIADYVSFNTYTADQTDWEKAAEAEVVDTPSGERFMEADLMELTKTFIAKTSTPAIFGTNFIDNFPDLPQLMWIFDKSFLLLAMDLPFWFPWPPLQRALVARRRLLSYLTEFNEALDKHFDGEDPGIKWQDIEDVSSLVKGRTEMYRKHGMSMKMRASCDLGLAWALNANTSPLVSWMLLEIYRDPVLLAQIRDEIAPYIKAVEPKNEFGMGVWIPPHIDNLDVEGLMNKCPLLKSAYVETLRVYTSSWSIKWLHQDTTLRESKSEDVYVLKKDSYAHVVQEIHQNDPAYFPNPEEWQGSRHVKESMGEDGKLVRTADMGTIRPYGKYSTLSCRDQG